MSTVLVSTTTDAWAPYEPSSASPWTLRRVIHLHRRAGLGADWTHLQRDLERGPRAAIQGMLDGGTGDPQSNALAERLFLAAARSGSIDRLQAAWVFRMLYSAHPLRERMTLMWHNHFATSYIKVGDLLAMREQNRILRAHALGPFGDLLRGIVRDPAMLLWLDAPANRRSHPNENLARELLELFTLGIDHFSEGDVKEAARALAGWTVQDGVLRIMEIRQDPGEKTILGQSRAFDGDGLIDLLLQHPATAERIAGRLCEQFMGEGMTTPEQETALAAQLVESRLDVGAAVALILRSEAFFAGANLGMRISEPAPHVIWALKALGRTEPQPTTALVAEWIRRLGQDLFNPPNVGGWPGGRSWLMGRSVVARANFAVAVADGAELGCAPLDASTLPRADPPLSDAEALIDRLSELLFGAALNSAERDRVLDLVRLRSAAELGTPRSLQQALVIALLTLPQAHLA